MAALDWLYPSKAVLAPFVVLGLFLVAYNVGTVSKPCQIQQDASPVSSEPRMQEPCPLPGAGRFSRVKLNSTGLLSFPGSGNTWTRHILTTATGILTASVYNNQEDVPLTGIRGRAQRVLVVKTHNLDKLPFSLDRYVIIIRNPYDCLLAAFNRRSEAGVPFQQHIAHQPKEAFLDEWDTFVDGSMKHWSSNYLNWSKLQKPVHLLVYHRLLAQLEPELRDVIDFLHEPSIHPMIHCAARDKEGDAHRQKEEWQEKFAVFSHKQKRYLNDAIDTVQEAWEKRTGKNFADFQKWKRP